MLDSVYSNRFRLIFHIPEAIEIIQKLKGITEISLIVTQQVKSYSIDVEKNAFTIVFILPGHFVSEFFSYIDNIESFDATLLDLNGNSIYEKTYKVLGFSKKYMEFSYHENNAVEYLVEGTLK